MADIEITVDGGTSKRLLTAGKYCDRNINVTATGGAAEPVIQPLEVTSNGTYTAPAGVDGYSPVTVNVSGGGGGLTSGNVYVNFSVQNLAVFYADGSSEMFTFPTEMQLQNVSFALIISQETDMVFTYGDFDLIYENVSINELSIEWIKVKGEVVINQYSGGMP